jgi:hypothetical protein
MQQKEAALNMVINMRVSTLYGHSSKRHVLTVVNFGSMDRSGHGQILTTLAFKPLID